jgi:hypothetical protein
LKTKILYLLRRSVLVIFISSSGLLLSGCRQRMADQPHYRPFEATDFFADGTSARPLVNGTIARGQWNTNDVVFSGRTNNQLVATIPIPLTPEILLRGKERYNIFCAPCHDEVGAGQGMIVRRGFTRPPSYHIDRLRDVPDGHFYDIMTHGFGRMPDYAAQIKVEDRWAIVAYIRALQLSQNSRSSDVPPEDLKKLQEEEAE